MKKALIDYTDRELARESADVNACHPSTVRIAIAEDDGTQRRLLQCIVQQLGYQIVCLAENGQQVIELCSEMEVDVVLMDLDMPEVDGLEAADQIAAWGIPVVLVSGMPDVKNLVVEVEPIASCLAKPVTGAAISEAISAALSRAG